ncbi:MAG TPA: alpha/beta hydrolase, partial [Planctomycetaceae bacterium]|nr:alpha/beta hydrolase [Planctomycetaceae bacterium]
MKSSSSRSSRYRRVHRVSSLELLESRHLLANANPVITVDGGTLTYLEGSEARVAPNAGLTDDNLNFGGGKLILKGTEHVSKWDFLTVRDEGTSAGQIGLSGDSVTYGGVEIGKLSVKAPVVGVPVVYKRVDGQDLRAFIVTPPETSPPTINRPAMILIHGGGWTSGGPGSLNEKALYLASRGMVCVLIEYRHLDVASTDPPIPCIQDVRSAVRWVRTHAAELGVDPNRIAAGGGSVGGQMAAGLGLIDKAGLDDPNDNSAISAKVNAVMMFYAEIDNGPGRWGYGRVGDLYPLISPAYNVSPGDAPVVAFYGGMDPLIPADVRDKFEQDMQAAGVRLDMYVYEDQFHGFDAYAWDNPYFFSTLRIADEFFGPQSKGGLGWLSGPPTIQQPTSPPQDTWVAESTITLNGNASPAAVEALMQNIRLTTSKDPGEVVRTITWQLDDGDGGLSNVAQSHIEIIPVNNWPQVNLFGTARYVEGATPFVLVPTTVILDPDSSVTSGASITVGYQDYFDSRDRLELQPTGTGLRQISLDGNILLYEGTRAGTWSGGAGGTPLVIRFDDNTPLLTMQETIRRVSFRTIGVNPTAITRMVRFVVDDGGENGVSLPAFKRVEVIPLNSAPVLDTALNARLGSLLQGATDPAGAFIKDLVAGAISDIDGKGQGVAITALGRVDRGSWQFSRDSGATWKDVETPPSPSSALLLPSDVGTKLRFVPDATFVGDLKVYYRAWDRTQGTAEGRWNLSNPDRVGGYSAFSEGLEDATLTVVARSRKPRVVLGGTINYTEKAAQIMLAAAATVSDPDSTHFAGGNLTVRISANASADDRLAIRNQGTEAGQIGISGSTVTFGGVAIGTFSGGIAQTLTINFTTRAATPAAAQALIRQVTFRTL